MDVRGISSSPDERAKTTLSSSSPHVLLTVFDDSLDPRWSVVVDPDRAGSTSLGLDNGHQFCSTHLRLVLGQQPAWFRSRSPLIELQDASLQVHLRFFAKQSNGTALRTPSCAHHAPAAQPCAAIVCVTFLPAEESPGAESPGSVPACAIGPKAANGWQQYAAAVARDEFSTTRPIHQLVLTDGQDGSGNQQKRQQRLTLVDDLQFVSELPPQHILAPFFFDSPNPTSLATPTISDTLGHSSNTQ